MFLISCIEGTDWIEACKSIACLPFEVSIITTFLYNAIRIVTPLILVIVGMFDMVKAITAGKEDEIKKSQQLLVKRAVAAAIIFLLFSLISWMLNILSSNDNSTQSVINCLNVLFGEKEDDGLDKDLDKQCRINGYDGFVGIYGNYTNSNYLEVYHSPRALACYKKDISLNHCSEESYILNDGKQYCIVTRNGKEYTEGTNHFYQSCFNKDPENIFGDKNKLDGDAWIKEMIEYTPCW